MRSLLLFCEFLALLPIAVVRPFVGVLVFSFISFANLHRLSWGFASDLPWAYLTVIATLIGCVVAREPKRVPVSATTILIVAFIAGITLTSFAALAPPGMVWAKWQQVTKVFVFLLVTAALVTDKYRVQALLWVMVISLGFYGVKGGGFTLLTAGSARVLGPPSTMIEDNNHLAAGLLVTLPIMNYLRMQAAHRIVRIGLLLGMVLTLFSVVGSYSRGALLGLAAVSFVLWFRSSNKIVTGVVVVVAVLGAISIMPDEWLQRMGTIQSYNQDSSAEGRLNMWRAAWAMAMDRPLTGSGFMGPYTAPVMAIYAPGVVPRAVHSIWFETLGENGFPTFFVWIAISAVGVWQTFCITRESRGVEELRWCSDLARMAQVSIVAYMVAGTFLSLCYWDFYFTLLVIIAGTRQIVRATVRDRARSRIVLPAWRRRPGIALPGVPAPDAGVARTGVHG